MVSWFVNGRRLGRTLFDAVVEREGVDAAHLAYDRPSAKMMPFLAKNFGLREHVQQPNNFVVFKAYFE